MKVLSPGGESLPGFFYSMLPRTRDRHAGNGRHDAPAARALFASLMRRKLTDVVDLCAAPAPSCRRRPASTAGHRRNAFGASENSLLVCVANHPLPLHGRGIRARCFVLNYTASMLIAGFPLPLTKSGPPDFVLMRDGSRVDPTSIPGEGRRQMAPGRGQAPPGPRATSPDAERSGASRAGYFHCCWKAPSWLAPPAGRGPAR